MIIPDPSISVLNTFRGSITQQATSVVTKTDPSCYEQNGGCFSVYGFEYKPGYNDAVSLSVVLLHSYSTGCSILPGFRITRLLGR
jgi:hypothetical protein